MRPIPVNPLRRAFRRFSEDPASIGNAVRLIIGVTVVAVFAGSAVIWLFDRREFPDYGTALWFSLQTVTTVGYGDVTPTDIVGRLATAVVMVTAIGLITIITAAITSTFVEAQRRRDRVVDAEERPAEDRIERRLEDIAARLERIERRLDAVGGTAESPATGGKTGGGHEPSG
jgi:voltage-gated potassium channel